MDLSFKTIAELQEFLGERLKAMRIDRGLTQSETAEKAGISLRAAQKLEAGDGSSIETFLRFLKAIGRTDALEILAPRPTVSPMAMLATQKQPMRVRHPRKKD